MAVDVKETLEILKVKLAGTKEKIADNNGWDIWDTRDVLEAVLIVVKEVEKISPEVGKLNAKQKKELAVDSLNWMIDIPVVPDFLEKKAIGWMVDFVVAGLNRWFGSGWASKAEHLVPEAKADGKNPRPVRPDLLPEPSAKVLAETKTKKPHKHLTMKPDKWADLP